MNLTQQFLSDVKIFMREFKISKTVLGLKTLNDHHAIIDWMNGTRKPLMKSVEKVYAYMEKCRKEKEI